MKRNRLLALLLSLCLVFCLTSGALAAEEAPEPECDEVLVIVHTNDVHGFIDVEPYVKAVADEMKAQYGEKNVLTISAGDVFTGGNAVAHLYNGETIPPIMDAAGYDVFVPGNNDFHFDDDQPEDLAKMFEHTKVLCGNAWHRTFDENGEAVTDEEGNSVPTSEVLFDATATFETEGGVKIGVFGVTTPGDPGVGLYVTTDTIECIQEEMATLQAEDCGIIIGVGHTGWSTDNAVGDGSSAAVVRAIPGIDVYVDGHSHSIINGGYGWICPETGTLVNQASCKGACLGVMKLYIKDGAVIDKRAEIIMEEDLQANYEPDPDVKALVDAAWERLAGDAGEMYIESEYFLNALRASESPDGRSVRTDETNLGDLVADFLVWYTGADVAMTPGFAIRCSIDAGEIYTLNLYDVFAIGCYVYAYEITGAELLQKMASSVSSLPMESPSFLQIGGASFGYLVENVVSDDAASGEASSGEASSDEAASGEAASGETASGEAASGEAASDEAASDEAASDEAASGEVEASGTTRIITIIDPKVGGEPLDPEKTYLYASTDGNSAPEGLDPLISTMEEGAAAMGEFLKSGEAVILPDVPTPDNRVVPMTEIPDGAVVFEVELAG